MGKLKQRIKDFLREQGVAVMGVAGPERMDGPPSMDPTYILRGARSIVCLALPMNVGAIYDFLGKKSPTPHNLDQIRGNQRMHRISKNLADFLISEGHRALHVPPNNTYRRSFDVFATYPNFSHRFGAMAAGIAGQGWSGNVMTEAYGAAVYLGTVVTDAMLESDPTIHPTYFIDKYCKNCKLCERACPSGMFEHDREEYVLLNGELHPRAERIDIDLCNASCFGLHGLSRDKKWSSWARHWITEWIDHRPDASQRTRTRVQMLTKGATTGDSTPRFEMIRRGGLMLFPDEVIDAIPEYEELPEGEQERNRILRNYVESIGVEGLSDANVLTCGHCALVCGPELGETRNRYQTLISSGIVVPDSQGRMVRTDSFERAWEIRRQNPPAAARVQLWKDSLDSAALWYKSYFGLEPKAVLQSWLYGRRKKKALEARGWRTA